LGRHEFLSFRVFSIENRRITEWYLADSVGCNTIVYVIQYRILSSNLVLYYSLRNAKENSNSKLRSCINELADVSHKKIKESTI